MNRKTISIIILICTVSAAPLMADIDARSLYQQGMDAFAAENWGSAELLFRKVVDSGDGEFLDRAWFHLARSIFNKKKYDAALFEFKNFLNRCRTSHLAIESRFWMGECYYRKGDFPTAIEEYRRYITSSGGGSLTPDAHDRIGDIYFSQKRWDEAIIEWEAAIAAGGAPRAQAILRLRIGEALFGAGNLDEAARRLEPLIYAPLDALSAARARLILGKIYQKKNEHMKALQVLGGIPVNLMESEPFNEALYLRARSLVKLGNIAQAGPVLEGFLSNGLNSPWYYYGLYEMGKILLQGPRSEEGIAMLEKVRKEASTPALGSRASLRLARWYRERKPERAVPYLEEALKTAAPDRRGGLLVLLGRTCIEAGKYEKAEETLSLYLKENPFDAGRDEIQFLRARAFLEMGDTRRAMEIFEVIRTDNPFSKFNAESNYYLAMIENKKGNTARAIERLNHYLRQKPGDKTFDALILLLDIHLGRDDVDAAGKTVEVLIRGHLARKGVENALYRYVAALMKKGRDTRRHTALLLNNFPASEAAADLHYLIGNDLFAKGQLNRAIDSYSRYLGTTFTKSRGDAYYRKLLALYRLNRYHEVIELVKKGEFPQLSEEQWREIPLLQARSYYRLNRPEDAYMVMSLEAARNYPKEDVLMFVRCALLVGDYRSAMEANDYLEKDRALYAESLYGIGEYFRKARSPDEAELYLKKVIDECPGTPQVELARLSLIEMLIVRRDCQEAMARLSAMAAPSLPEAKTRMSALTIRCQFAMNMTEQALAGTEENLASLMAGDYGEAVIRDALRHYHAKKDLQQFGRYAQYLSRYRGNEALINYLSGRLYLAAGNFQRSQYHFLALSRMESRYLDEAWYYLGMHAMLVNRSAPAAEAHFNRLLGMQEGGERLKNRTRIELALIYRDTNRRDMAMAVLNEIIGMTNRGTEQAQALNLAEEFGGDARGGRARKGD